MVVAVVALGRPRKTWLEVECSAIIFYYVCRWWTVWSDDAVDHGSGGDCGSTNTRSNPGMLMLCSKKNEAISTNCILEKFCWCNEDDVGNVIVCDVGEMYPIEWFHYSRVGLYDDPQGSRYFSENWKKKKKKRLLIFVSERYKEKNPKKEGMTHAYFCRTR